MPDSTGTTPPDGATGPAPLSLTQEQLWVLDRLEPGNASYNSTAMWRLDGPLDVEVLAACLRRIVDRQEMLRTSFASVDGVPYQVVAEDVPLPLTVTDLTDLPEDRRDAEADRLVHEAVHRPFDLGRAPLFRVELVRTGPERHVMVLVVHHIVSDGWSFQVLLQEVADLYAGAVTGTEVKLPPLPRQFTQYAREQRERLAGPRGRTLLKYWTERLAGAPASLDLPADRPRPTRPSFRGDRHVFQVPHDLRQELNRLAQRSRASLFMVTLAGFKALLSRITGQQDLLVGTPVGNRDRPEWSALVGYFADTLVMRTDLSDDPTFRELLGRVRKTALEAFVHRDLPFRMLVEELAPERAANRNPLFQVMFILQNIPARRRQVELPGVTMTRLDDVRSTSIFDVRLDLFEFEDELRGQLEYSTDLFDRPTIERMTEQYLALLADACAGPERRVSALSLGAADWADGFNDDLGGI
ncbi:condensation domain-containing protein [Streptomyces megasporus]|uniref:condensation domain-containing protein n=1 Tax=Streptomyces megasporus TaxID=44060 RepID=UPI00068DBACD|nr:condensation domain-containing protein [Streptomyces megasporus]